ncbi:MAG: iron-sulfur cluster-binding domain-containing protein [Chitinophagaceae bacterium]|nr:iron-sulfur cluster-binding domain-containing protein [Chitinophagaceae bacterium]
MQYLVKSVIKETDSAVTLVLDTIGAIIEYEAGQFITFIFSTRTGEEERRSYSISSIPDEPLSITVKRVPNGSYSRILVEKVKAGDILTGLIPAGFFTLPHTGRIISKKSFVFFAAGSGITPIYSQIKALLKNQMADRIVLVYSNQSKKDVIFYTDLMKLSSEYRSLFSVYFFFSDESDYRKARLSSSIVSEILTQEVGDNKMNTWLYLCGPFQYMLMVTMVARGMGFMNEQIKKEQFVIEYPSVRIVPPDVAAHTITLIENGKQVSWISKYPDTILQSAKRNGIQLPFSCEAGQCGTCSATCMKGKVWMYKNDVLMEDEMKNGRILTCTAYPIEGDIILNIRSVT